MICSVPAAAAAAAAAPPAAPTAAAAARQALPLSIEHSLYQLSTPFIN
jgi:ABC-type sugar transport system substrate-binding protein